MLRLSVSVARDFPESTIMRPEIRWQVFCRLIRLCRAFFSPSLRHRYAGGQVEDLNENLSGGYGGIRNKRFDLYSIAERSP